MSENGGCQCGAVRYGLLSVGYHRPLVPLLSTPTITMATLQREMDEP